MTEFMAWLRRVWRGERRQRPRVNQERAEVINRQWAAAVKLARVTGRTPEELLDYRQADRILAGKGR